MGCGLPGTSVNNMACLKQKKFVLSQVESEQRQTNLQKYVTSFNPLWRSSKAGELWASQEPHLLHIQPSPPFAPPLRSRGATESAGWGSPPAGHCWPCPMPDATHAPSQQSPRTQDPGPSVCTWEFLKPLLVAASELQVPVCLCGWLPTQIHKTPAAGSLGLSRKDPDLLRDQTTLLVSPFS